MSRLLLLTKRVAKSLLRRLLAFVSRHPRLRSVMISAIQRIGLNGIARRAYTGLVFTPQYGARKQKGTASLSPRARQIYMHLKATIKNKKKRGA